jgi:hypothetical protein
MTDIKISTASDLVCDCGAPIDIDGPLEDQHFVFAMRANGERSNLGYCPVKHGFGAAVTKARAALTGHALYRGRVQ